MATMVFNNTQEMLKYTKNITAKSLDLLGEELQDYFADKAQDAGFSVHGAGSPLAYKTKATYGPRLNIEMEYSEEDIPHDDVAYGGSGWYEDSWNINTETNAWHHTSPSWKKSSDPQNLLAILRSKNVRSFIKADNSKPGIWGTARAFANQGKPLVDPFFFEKAAKDRAKLRSFCKRTLRDTGLPII